MERGLRICVVDDEVELLRTIAKFLEINGMEVRRFSSFAQVMAFFETEDASSCDVLVSDMDLMDGYGSDLIEMVAMEHPRIRTILMSGKIAALDDTMKADAFLKKPFRMTELLEILSTPATLS